MNGYGSLRRALIICSVGLLGTCAGFSAIILDSGFTALTVNDPIQGGRLSRNGVPSDWSAYKQFPGIITPSSILRYQVFTVPVSPFPFLQISVDDPNAAMFASAYLNAYTPNFTDPNRGLNVNYLGDEGRSGNPFGNPNFFQIFLPSPETNRLLIVVNATGTTLGDPFRILVEGFYDSQYNDTTPVPEPAGVSLALLGAVGLLTFARSRRSSI